jgi:hypothetical protein
MCEEKDENENIEIRIDGICKTNNRTNFSSSTVSIRVSFIIDKK